MNEFGEDGASTAVHQMQGERATLQANDDRKDWDAMQTWGKNACSHWNSDQKDTGRTSKCDYSSGTRGAITRDSVRWVFTGQSVEEQAQEWQERLQSAQATDQNVKPSLAPSRNFPLHKQVKGALSRSRQRQSPGSMT